MSTCESDAGQKVEELRRALDRSQALLAHLEAQCARRPTEEDTAGVVDTIIAAASNNEPSEDEEAPLDQSSSHPSSQGALNAFKSRLTQLFVGNRVEKATKKTPETAPRILSFTRVNIGFPADTRAAENLEIRKSGESPNPPPLTSPQLASRNLQRSWTSNTARHTSGPVANRAISFTAATFTSTSPTSRCLHGNTTTAAASGNAAAPFASSAVAPEPQPQQLKQSQPDASAAEPIVTRRAYSGPSSNRLVPTLTAAAASCSSQSQRRIVFRDTVWAPSGPDSPSNDPLRPLRPSSSLQKSYDNDDTVSIPYNPSPTAMSPQAARPNSYSSSITPTPTPTPTSALTNLTSARNEVRWAVRDKALPEAQLAPQLPQLYGSMGSSKLPQQLFVANTANGDPHQRPESSVPYRSFTTGASVSPGTRSGTQRAPTYGSVGTEEALRRTTQALRALQSLTSSSSLSSSWTVTGTQLELSGGGSVPGSVPDTVTEPGDAESELSSTLATADHAQGHVLQKQQQQQDCFLAQYTLDAGKPAWASVRLAGIPEAGGESRTNPVAHRARSGWRRSIDLSSSPQYLTFSPAGPVVPVAAAPVAPDAAAGPGASRVRFMRRQTWSNNEVIIPARE